jgi:hypothetical protein
MDNSASGGSATIPGGQDNVADGDNSFAAGDGARALHDGSFVWADGSVAPTFDSTAVNQFLIRAAGGVGIGRNDPAHPIHLASGAHVTAGGTWTNASDISAKDNFFAVDVSQVLEAVAALPISTWNYKTEDSSVRHMGPMAQDFKAAFEVGQDDRHISTVDADGVALAAIQGLYQLLQAQQREIEMLKLQLEASATDQD